MAKRKRTNIQAMVHKPMMIEQHKPY